MVEISRRHLVHSIIIDGIELVSLVHHGTRSNMRSNSCPDFDEEECEFGCSRCLTCDVNCRLFNKYHAWLEAIITAGKTFVMEYTFMQRDFSLSSEKLLHMFDAYCKDKLYRGSRGGVGRYLRDNFGSRENRQYDRMSKTELLVNLFWEMRNILSHKGGIIDESLINVWRNASSGSNWPECLPRDITIGCSFSICYDDYLKLDEAIHQIIEENENRTGYGVYLHEYYFVLRSIRNFRLMLKTGINREVHRNENTQMMYFTPDGFLSVNMAGR